MFFHTKVSQRLSRDPVFAIRLFTTPGALNAVVYVEPLSGVV